MYCVHHWIIPSAEETVGEWSLGKCRKCGDTKKFNNITPNLNLTDFVDALAKKQQQEYYDNE